MAPASPHVSIERVVLHGLGALVLFVALGAVVAYVSGVEDSGAIAGASAPIGALIAVAAMGISALHQKGRRSLALACSSALLGMTVVLLLGVLNVQREREALALEPADRAPLVELEREDRQWLEHPTFRFRFPHPGQEYEPLPEVGSDSRDGEFGKRVHAYGFSDDGGSVLFVFVVRVGSEEQFADAVEGFAGFFEGFAGEEAAERIDRALTWTDGEARATVEGQPAMKLRAFRVDEHDAVVLAGVAPAVGGLPVSIEEARSGDPRPPPEPPEPEPTEARRAPVYAMAPQVEGVRVVAVGADGEVSALGALDDHRAHVGGAELRVNQGGGTSVLTGATQSHYTWVDVAGERPAGARCAEPYPDLSCPAWTLVVDDQARDGHADPRPVIAGDGSVTGLRREDDQASLRPGGAPVLELDADVPLEVLGVDARGRRCLLRRGARWDPDDEVWTRRDEAALDEIVCLEAGTWKRQLAVDPGVPEGRRYALSADGRRLVVRADAGGEVVVWVADLTSDGPALRERLRMSGHARRVFVAGQVLLVDLSDVDNPDGVDARVVVVPLEAEAEPSTGPALAGRRVVGLSPDGRNAVLERAGTVDDETAAADAFDYDLVAIDALVAAAGAGEDAEIRGARAISVRGKLVPVDGLLRRAP